GGAVGVLFELRRTIGGFIDGHKLDAGDSSAENLTALTTGMTLLKELAGILGVFRKPVEKPAGGDDAFTGDLMQLIIDVRAIARENKSWDIADTIRDRLGELKVTLEDRPDGTSWRRE
ncbi:MAG: cysteine--tRNA ligase, partial [Planctomycetaceae bacterium]